MEQDLVEKIVYYLDDLNNAFDFISPLINDNFGEDYAFTEQLSQDIWKWIIKAENILKNYKWTYTKEAIYEMAEWKDWMKLFVDIKDMWIMNIEDFQRLAKLVANQPDGKNFDQLIEEELSKAWFNVTKRFIRTVKNINEKYPDAKISLWWDEVFIFIPWATKSQEQKILNDINEMLLDEDLKWRISSSFEKNNVKKVFDELDVQTKVNKVFEENIEKVIYDNKYWEKIEMPETVSLIIKTKSLNEQLIKNIENYSEQIDLLVKNNSNSLLKLMKKEINEWVEIYLWTIENLWKISISREENWHVIVSIE